MLLAGPVPKPNTMEKNDGQSPGSCTILCHALAVLCCTGAQASGAVPLHRWLSLALPHWALLDSASIAMSQRNGTGWMVAAELDNLPTAEREAKWQNFQGVLTFSSHISSSRSGAFR